MTTIGETVSRLRNNIKAVKTDPFITDRFLYSMVLKYGRAYMKQQDTIRKLLRLGTLFRTLPCMELIDVNRVEACCGDIGSDCPIKRTEDRLPNVMEADFGPIIRTVSSIDGSIEVYPTTPSSYTSMTKTGGWKYNRLKYYWFLDGYLYIPSVTWDSVRVDGIFEGDLTMFSCDEDDKCGYRQDQATAIPDFLFAEIEKMVMADLGFLIQAPEDVNSSDKQSTLR